MRLIIRDDAQAVAAYVANYIANRIKEFNPCPKRPFVLGLPTGSSPISVYKLLGQKYRHGEVWLTIPDPFQCHTDPPRKALVRQCHNL